MLSQSITAAGAAAIAAQTAEAAPSESRGPFRYCLNTSTIRGQKLPLVTELEIAARAGYQAVEPWVAEIDQYVAGGGTLSELRRRIADLGLEVADLIGFAEWIVDDEAPREGACRGGANHGSGRRDRLWPDCRSACRRFREGPARRGHDGLALPDAA